MLLWWAGKDSNLGSRWQQIYSLPPLATWVPARNTLHATQNNKSGILITAFLFGIYHLPYAYFSADWPPHGDFVWGLSSVLAEQMVAGALLGILWWRTRNIAAPVLLHALVNTAAIMTSLNFG